MDNHSAGFSRRAFLARSGYALVGGLALPALTGPARAQAASAARLGDAHVHLFNLADLPARGFFEHGVMWNRLDFWIVRPMWPAMLDMIAFLKSRTITARDELRAYPRVPPEIGWDEFKAMSNRRISNMARQSGVYGGAYPIAPEAPLSAPQRRLRDSYYQLAAWFGIFGEPVLRQFHQADVADCAFLEDADIERIHQRSREALIEGSCPEEPNPTSNSGRKQTIKNMFGWAHMLMQSRQYHLQAYCNRIGDGPLRVSRIVNLLVDYDEWLGDDPAPGSDADAQIELWERIRSGPDQSIDIRIFAGFDPLRDGLERRGFRRAGAPAGPTTFERNCARWRAQGIHGFKLYPPMGFRPQGNEPGMFRGNRRALGVVRDRLAQCGLGWHELPGLLNDSLRRFYAFCGRYGVPILAHAMHSNEASLCSGAHAGPSGWAEVVGQCAGLRICLAHFAETNDFLPAAKRHRAHRSTHPRNWPFHGTDALLLRNERRRNEPGLSEVFVDLGDMIEFLPDRRGADRAVAFFRELNDYCETNDRERKHVMFGTDWIMFEREQHGERYVPRIRAAMAATGWTDEWQQNLLHDNLQRFLEPRPPLAGQSSCSAAA